MKIEVVNPTIETRIIKGKNGDFELHNLTAYAYLDKDSPHPEKVVMQVDKNDHFKVGFHELQPESFKIGQFNRLEFNKAVLIPLPVKPPALNK